MNISTVQKERGKKGKGCGYRMEDKVHTFLGKTLSSGFSYGERIFLKSDKFTKDM